MLYNIKLAGKKMTRYAADENEVISPRLPASKKSVNFIVLTTGRRILNNCAAAFLCFSLRPEDVQSSSSWPLLS